MFSTDAKDEIARVSFECPRCASVFWLTLGLCAGRAVNDRWIIKTKRSATARAALRAAKAAGIFVATVTPRSPDGGRRAIEVAVENREASFARTLQTASFARTLQICCRRAWLRGAFLGCGSVQDPQHGYHLEFSSRDRSVAQAIDGVLNIVGIAHRRTRRRGRHVVYAKSAPAIADLLAQMGAVRAVLALDNLVALRTTKNAIRRRVNSEAANAARAAASSVRQRDAAARVLRRTGAPHLSHIMREAARLRIAYPDATLAELACRARPPVPKPTMAYRMRALERLARKDAAPAGRNPKM